MLQSLLVGLIVASAAVYSVWALMPAGARRSAVARLARRLRLGDSQARRLEAAVAVSGCSDCSSCKGCETPSPTPSPAGSEGWQPVRLKRRTESR